MTNLYNRSSVRVAISGMGCVTCAGAGVNSLWRSALEERTGIHSGLGQIPNRLLSQGNGSRALTFAMASISEAMEQAKWSQLQSTDGLIIATTTGQISLWETELTDFIQKKISIDGFDEAWKSQTLGSIVGVISKNLNFTGRSLLLSSACSAATQAVALGSLWIEMGHVKRCLIGGIETLSNLTIEGFKSLQLLSSTHATPFDQNRNGINLGEGSAFLCLEQNPRLPLATVSGYGMSTDAYHMTAPHPEGRGSLEAMQMALRRASLNAEEIGWIHAHGTGSKANDQAEGTAIASLFGVNSPWTSSTKWVHGHTLGASGAVESILCVKGLQEQKILKTSGLLQPDPLIHLRHPENHLEIKIEHVLKNTLGFGGNNAALIFSHPLAEPPRPL